MVLGNPPFLRGSSVMEVLPFDQKRLCRLLWRLTCPGKTENVTSLTTRFVMRQMALSSYL